MATNRFKNIITNIMNLSSEIASSSLFFVFISVLTLLSLCAIDGHAKHYVYVAQRDGHSSPIKISGSQSLYRVIGDSLTFTLAVDLFPPQVVHDGLQQISPIEKSAVIQGTVTDNDPLAYVNIYYVTDKDLEISTQTIIISYNTNYFVFKTTITLDTTGANYFYYRIEAVCLAGEHGYWPNADGNYYYAVQKNKFAVISYKKSINLSTLSGLFHRVAVSAENSAVVTSKGGEVTLINGDPFGGATSITFPDGALSSNQNIKITELVPSTLPDGTAPAVSEKPVAAYSFEPEGLVFNSPATIKLLYKDSDGNGIVDSYPETSLRVFWWDGVAWRYLGGEVDTAHKVVIYERLSHFSTYALFPVSALSNDDYRPKERIITPATVDTKNDYMSFSALSPEDTVNIYDVTGRRIRQLRGNANLAWDGKDDGGNLVESGLYVYQIKKANNTIISGTVVVAK